MSDSDMTNSCSSCGSSSCGGSDCSTCSGCSTDANQHSTITLTMEDDTEVECAILTIFPVDAKEYIALLPLDEEGQNHDGEVYLYSFTRTAEGATKSTIRLLSHLTLFYRMHEKQKLPEHL